LELHCESPQPLCPKKSRPDQKTDAAVALLMASGRDTVETGSRQGLEGFLLLSE
jgi:hypothetical protein